MIKSMTGFGRAEAVNELRKITVEMKSVNNRYFDCNIRLPKKYSAFEADVRGILKEYVSRGKVDVFVTEETYAESSSEPVLSEALAAKYADILKEITNIAGVSQEIRACDIARFPDVITLRQTPVDEDELKSQLVSAVRSACEKFDEARITEGKRLHDDIISKLSGMKANVDEIIAREPEILADYRKRLSDKIEEILGDRTIDEGQLAAAVVIYTDKICTDEETVRLKSHIEQVALEIEKKESVGRKLDFLAQEMNRESNTILSKAGDLATSNLGIALKTDVEKIREQIQNIE